MMLTQACRLNVVALMVASSVMVAQSQGGGAPAGSVHVNVVDTFGGSLTGAQIQLLNERRVPVEVRFSNYNASGVPYGSYRLRVRVAGFATAEEPFHLQVADAFLTVALEVSPPEGPPERGTVAGSLAPKSEGFETCWVRITGTFMRFVSDARVTKSGYFLFEDVPLGTYVLMVFRDNTLIQTSQMEVRKRYNNVTITVSGR